MMTLSRRERLLSLATLSITLLAVTKYGYLNFRSQELAASLKIKSVRIQLASLNGETPTAAPARSISSVATVDSGSRFASVFAGISESIDPLQTEILRFAETAQVKSDGYSKSTYTLELRSPFLPIGQLIERIEKSDLMVDIESIEMAHVEHDLQRLTATLLINNYVKETR